MIDLNVRAAARKSLCSMSAVLLLLFSLHSFLLAQVEVKLPEMSGRAGSEIRIPLVVGDLESEKVTGFEFVVSCDTSIIRFSGVEQSGTLSEGLAMFANNRVAPFHTGRMKVVCASAYRISGNGVLVRIVAVLAKKAGTSPIVLSDVVLNAGKPEARTINGVVRSKEAADVKQKRRGDTSRHAR
jgi:hypothetical protein